MKEANDILNDVIEKAIARNANIIEELRNRIKMLEKWAEDHQNLHNAIERGD